MKYHVKDCIIPYFLPKKIKLKDLTPVDLEKYINAKMEAVANKTVRKYLTNMSKCLNSAVDKCILVFNPVKAVEWTKKEEYTGAKVYNEEQIIKLLEISKGDPMELMILLTIYYGLRRSEVLGIKWDSIDFEQSTITIKHTVTKIFTEVNHVDYTKTKSSNRVLPLSDEIAGQLRALKKQQDELRLLQPNDYKSEGYIFTKPDGSLISTDYPSHHFKRLIKKHGLPIIRFHDLRA